MLEPRQFFALAHLESTCVVGAYILTIKEYFYFQVKDDILNELIYCPAEKAVLLASYQVQCKFLDYEPTLCEPGYLANEKLLSKTVIDQHKLSMEEWEEKISSFHKQHKVNFSFSFQNDFFFQVPYLSSLLGHVKQCDHCCGNF